MPRDTRRRFLEELAKVEPRIADAFAAAIQDIRSASQLRAIEAAIERGYATGNIARAVQEVSTAINLGSEFFAPLDRQIVEAFIEGGAYQVGLLPKRPPNTAPRLVARFDHRNPRAEAWTRRNTGRLIAEITRDTENVIRETITAGFEENRGQRAIALDLIGRTEGNQRTGGLIGLHSRQAAAVRKARAELMADKSLVNAEILKMTKIEKWRKRPADEVRAEAVRRVRYSYFTRDRRDKRFDATVRKAITAGKPLSAADVDNITARYSDRLLQLRGATIARTEGNKAMQAGRTEAMQQLIDSGKVPASAVSKIWDAVIGPRTRDSHIGLNGQEVKWGEPFVSPVTGALLDHPHDEDAPGSEVISCRCTMRTRIDYTQLAT